MSLLREPQRLFRDREGDNGERVTFVELFFDLVFVFAVTQLSHTLLDHLTPLGVLETLMMLVAIWWVWMYTTWATNWMDPETGPVRAMLIVLMLFGLVLSTSIPEAFEDRAIFFAVAYVSIQVGRTAFIAIAYLPVDRGNGLNLVRITVWFLATAPLWIGGALLGGTAQVWMWAIAIAVEITGPAFQYFTPGLGASDVTSWNISGGHMAERSGLFIIIALGESVLVTGTAVSELEISATSVSSFLAAFTGTILLWLLYFSHGAEGGARFIRRAESAGSIARLSYVYLHIPIVAGIVVVAVGDELVLEHPSGEIEFAAAAAVALGPAIYLLGVMLFKRSVGAPWLVSHLLGIVACVVVFAVATLVSAEWLDALVLTWLVNAVLAVIVVLDEWGVLHRPRAGGGVGDHPEEVDAPTLES